MKILDNERLREMLAAEFSLGTLRGAARRRFKTWMRDDADLRSRVDAWNERLAPLMDSVPERRPPQRVWDEIEARLPGFSAMRGDRFAPPATWWERLGFWRGLSAAFAIVAVVSLGLLARPGPRPVTEVKFVEIVPTAIASVVDPKDGHLVATVMQTRSGAVVLKVAADVEIPSGRELQLWVTANGKDLVSVGLVPASARATPATMRMADVALLSNAKAFGLSLEPTGGSPQPTQVLGLGAAVPLSS